MAASMLTLLFTAFLLKVGVQFDWVTYHWIAGNSADGVHPFSRFSCFVLAGLLGDLAPIERTFRTRPNECEDSRKPAGSATAEVRQISSGEQALSRRNCSDRLIRDLYWSVHAFFRVRTMASSPGTPYLFSDMTWGLMYVLHGLAGVGLIALVMVHV